MQIEEKMQHVTGFTWFFKMDRIRDAVIEKCLFPEFDSAGETGYHASMLEMGIEYDFGH